MATLLMENDFKLQTNELLLSRDACFCGAVGWLGWLASHLVSTIPKR
jgi:hypothetical protein